MRIFARPFALVLMLFTMVGVVNGQEAAPVLSRFQEVTKELDKGGDLYLYLSAKETIELVKERYPLVLKMIYADAEKKGPAEEKKTKLGMKTLEGIIGASGIEDLTAIGASSAPLGGKLHRSKIMMYHAPGKGQGRIWKMFGAKSHRLEILDMLPQDTAFATYGDADLGLAWEWLMETMNQVGDETAKAQLNAGLTIAKGQGLDLEAMIKSTAGSFGYMVTLNEKNMITMGKQNIEFPEPAFMSMMKVKDDKILKTLQSFWTKYKIAVGTERLGDQSVLYRVNLPMGQGMPFPFALTIGTHKDWLLIGSTADIVANAIKVDLKKAKGLTATREFRRLSKGLPEEGTQFAYMAPMVSEYASAILEKGITKKEGKETARDIIKILGLEGAPLYGCTVTQRKKNGILMIANSNVVLSRALLSSAIGAPIAMAIAAEEKKKRAGKGEQNVNAAKKNMAKLQQIGLGLMLYADDNKGIYPTPDGAVGLSKLVEKGILTAANAYIHPGDKTRKPKADLKKLSEGDLSYVYVGSGFKDSDGHPAITPICFDKPGMGRGVTVLFIDGHAEHFDGQFANRVAVIEFLKTKLRIPNDRYQVLLKKAKALDNK